MKIKTIVVELENGSEFRLSGHSIEDGRKFIDRIFKIAESKPCTIQNIVGSDFNNLMDLDEEEDYLEVDETLFAIESNFPPSNMTEEQWNKDRS